MSQQPTKQSKILTIVALSLLSLAVIGLILYGLFADNSLKNYTDSILDRTGSAFHQLIHQVNGLSAQFVKVSASDNADMTASLLTEIWQEASEAQHTLSQLPLGDKTRQQLTAYFNTAGDYARQMAKKLETGEALREEDKAQLVQVKNTCAALSQKLMEAWANGYTGDVDLDAFLPASESQGQEPATFLGQEIPHLIYDGPFSSSILEKEPANVKEYTVTEQQALEIAQDFSGVSLTPSTHSDGYLAYYHFLGERDGQEVHVSITKQGGELLYYFLRTNPDGLTILPTESREKEVIALAQQFLTQRGYPACSASYVTYYNGNALVNLVPLEDGRILLYPDLIKVWVNLETNQVVGLDTRHYLVSHTSRILDAPKISLQEAQKQLSPTLNVEKTALAVIPLEDGTERQCYEFTCKAGAQDCLVYLDVETGEEVDILALQHTNTGTLVQ